MILYIHEFNVKLDGEIKEKLLAKALADFSMYVGGTKSYLLPLDIELNEFGKPFIKNSNLFFSISHTENLWMCAVGENEVGFDAEVKSRVISTDRIRQLSKRFFTDAEGKFIGENKEKFLYIWTRKEAYVKYSGRGLGQGLETFNVLDQEGFIEVPQYGEVIAACYAPESKGIKKWVKI